MTIGSSGFQTFVNTQPAPAVVGDFCDANPRYTVDAGPGGLIAGSLGLYVGRFAWLSSQFVDGDNAPAVANNYGTGQVGGFVHRDQQGLLTTYLQTAGLLIPGGFQVTVFSGGGFWVVNDGAAQALPGMKAYATFANGLASFAATGSPSTSGAGTGTIAAGASSFNGYIANNQLHVVSALSGLVPVGSIIAGAGVASGSKIVAQLSGTALGVGVYALSIPEQVVGSPTSLIALTGSYALLTIASGLSGGFAVGDVLSTSGGVAAGTTITALGTGTGGLGTYYVDQTQTVGSGSITTAAENVETKWYCMSPGLPGELVKISDQPLG